MLQRKGKKKEKIIVPVLVLETEENEVNKVSKYWIIGIFKVKARLKKNRPYMHLRVGYVYLVTCGTICDALRLYAFV